MAALVLFWEERVVILLALVLVMALVLHSFDTKLNIILMT